MRIEIVGRNVEVTDELREDVHKRFQRLSRQVSELATLDIELREERNPAIRERCVVEATLPLKGVTLRAEEASEDFLHSIALAAEDIRRQVKRHREKRRKRSQTRRMVGGRRRAEGPAAGAP